MGRHGGGDAVTGLNYCKRYRLELALVPGRLPCPELPAGFQFVPWHEAVLARHAEAKYRAFADEFDSAVFPCLATYSGCQKLMEAIRSRPGFIPEATWLLVRQDECCGTVQGVHDDAGTGAIQNLGIVPEFRGIGLGRALLLQSLHGFLAAGISAVALEVTANNSAAMGLYRSLGFQRRRVVYKVATRQLVAEPAPSR